MTRTNTALSGLRSFLGLALAFALAGCYSTAGGEDGEDSVFRYQEATGTCRNAAGEAGFNPYDSVGIQRSKNAQCVDLSGVDLKRLEWDTWQLDTLRFVPAVLAAWDFRGAKLTGSEINFASIEAADFRGADLRHLQYGYVVLKGMVDAFTRLPGEGTCRSDGNQVECWN